MNLINKKILSHKIQSYEFPLGEKLMQTNNLLDGWIKALKDSNLDETKEKSVQGKFLSTFFESILGFTDVTTGNDEWTLIQHPRIENDGMEPDGSLGWFTKKDGLTKAVIELKDARTLLDKKQTSRAGKLTPVEQAYLYSTKYEGCDWIIVSNFREIRLYNKHRTQEYYEKFEVMDLKSESEFKRFYYLLCKENLISKSQDSVLDDLAKNSAQVEQDITKKFYSEYKQIRLSLLDHLTRHNPGLSKIELLEKAQKLLDRFIFTLFCEDTSNLLPLNIVRDTYDRAVKSFSSSEVRVWDEFKGLFSAIDKGNSRVKPPINAYNGGLFAYDSVLDKLNIKDDFWPDLLKLGTYDFETDLNVNILGHIFEQSISDLESLKFELNNEIQDKKDTKRKRDGIYYTPEYITRYIVENTVGKFLEEYPDKLETIKVLDPACGSGAFLNQTHTFLMREHKNRHNDRIDEKLLRNEAITLFDYNPAEMNRGILLNNIYGVDLNQESVEITKLALWLKTARSSEPLQNLDKNIKCGNSLIDDVSIAGNKAFNWHSEFVDVLVEGGFDVIIGNPPYVSTKQIPQSDREFYWNRYGSILSSEMDLYQLFLFKSLNELLKNGGYLGFITPDSFHSTTSFEPLRKFILANFQLIEIVDFPYRFYPFEDVNTETCIHIYKKILPQTNKTKLTTAKKDHEYVGIMAEEEHWLEQNKFKELFEGNIVMKPSSVLIKILSKDHRLGEFVTTHKGWMSVPKNTSLENTTYDKGTFDEQELNDNPLLKTITAKYLEGRDIHRYHIDETKKYVNVFSMDKKTQSWHNQPKILLQRIVGQNKSKIFATIDFDNHIVFPSANIINSDNTEMLYVVLAIINSKLMDYFYNKFYGESNTNVTSSAIESLPMPNLQIISNDLFKVNILQLIDVIDEKVQFISKIKNILSAEYSFDKYPMGFTRIDDMGWNQFVEIFDKNHINLDISKKEQLLEWFKDKQRMIQEFNKQITILSNQINTEVYKLYDLADDEINIIESWI